MGQLLQLAKGQDTNTIKGRIVENAPITLVPYYRIFPLRLHPQGHIGAQVVLPAKLESQQASK